MLENNKDPKAMELMKISWAGKDLLEISNQSEKTCWAFRQLVEKFYSRIDDLIKADDIDVMMLFVGWVHDFAWFVYGDIERTNYFSTKVVNDIDWNKFN